MNYKTTELACKIMPALDRLVEIARDNLRARIVVKRRISAAALERHQYIAHGLAWFATYVEALRQLERWAGKLELSGEFGELDACILTFGFGEYLSQLRGGIMMNQSEIVRLDDIGLSIKQFQQCTGNAADILISKGCSDRTRRRLVTLLARQGNWEVSTGLSNEMELVRQQFRRLVEVRVAPHAHRWHLENQLIPMELVKELADLGVFGLIIPEEFMGCGLSRVGMCVVTEELSRGSLAVGSLATRSEIASELIRVGGTAEQKRKWLPMIATGACLPAAVFTEPQAGSDLATLQTRAIPGNGHYLVTGQKTWITHAGRADLMIVLVRTDPESASHRGLSILLAPKQPGDDEVPFPDDGLSGSEIDVLGYRGMKEFELALENFRVAKDNLLGGEEGYGFRQLMETFESARIQTAARAIGVAQSALDLGGRHACERHQFGKPLIAFPRVAGKLAMMAVEIAIARQLAYFAARCKDSGRRCDKEAGMAKMLASRVAWAAADNAVQIHGGAGYALECNVSRVFCDARLLNLFEGSAEIQANVIARSLLESRAN